MQNKCILIDCECLNFFYVLTIKIWTAQSFPTHLLNIQPKDNAQFWSPEACKFFKELVEGKTFQTVVVARTSVKFPEGFPEHVEYNGVCMIQRNTRVTVQGELVRAGFAELTGPL